MKSKRLLISTIGVLSAVSFLFPFFIILLNALKNKADIIQYPLAITKDLSFSNYIEAFNEMNYLTSIMNSLLITVSSVIVLIVFTSMLAYYLVRHKTVMTKIIFIVLIASMIIPFQALMIPFVTIYGKLGMLNSRLSLICFYLGFGVSLSTFLFHGFIKTIPTAIDESAMMDGASQFRLFWSIIFPMLKPIASTVAILNVLWIWNDFLLPSLVLFQEARTLPLSTFAFFGKYTSQYGLAMAGLVLSIVPVVIFYLIMQKYIISGVTQGSLK